MQINADRRWVIGFKREYKMQKSGTGLATLTKASLVRLTRSNHEYRMNVFCLLFKRTYFLTGATTGSAALNDILKIPLFIAFYGTHLLILSFILGHDFHHHVHHRAFCKSLFFSRYPKFVCRWFFLLNFCNRLNKQYRFVHHH